MAICIKITEHISFRRSNKKKKQIEERVQHEPVHAIASQAQKCVNCCNALCDVYNIRICNDRGDEIFFK